jgi:glycosyltransferase involved in cell wall biosynthesis
MQKLIVDGWWLTRSGVGLATYAERVVRLLTGLELAGMETRVALPKRFPEPSRRVGPVVQLACPRLGHPLLDAVLWQLRVSVYAARQAADAVFFSPGPFWAPWAPRHCGVAYHDCIYRHFPGYLGRWGIRRWLALKAEGFLNRCDGVVTESLFSREEIRRFARVPQERIAVIPAWLPDDYTPPAASFRANAVRARYELPARYWLYVGGYDYRKNIGLLLAAYARAAGRGACPPLVLAGRIPASREAATCDVLGELRRCALRADQVRRPGFIAAGDMPGLYAGAELTIYPSLYEGFGLPPLEALGCGCPALVADNSSLSKIVTDADYRFATADPEPLAARLSQAANRPLPLNPGFRREAFTEQVARERYRVWLAARMQQAAEGGDARGA